EVWVLDLGGEGRGARKEENVFAIQTPVAIVTLVRTGKASRAATVRYRRIQGTRAEKFEQLDQVKRLDPTEGWTVIEAADGQPFMPESTDERWGTFPLLADLFPWQQPGIMYNRAWPVAPSSETLRRRWRHLLETEDADERTEKFVAAKTGRNIHTKVGQFPPLATLPIDAEPEPTVRVAWRSFDPQWTFDDARVANLRRPALWQALPDTQVCLVSPWSARLGSGPAATVSPAVPGKHYFRGSFGGKDVLPLYRDAAAKHPNITRGLLDLLSERLGSPVTPEDFLAYCYTLLAHPGYTDTFTESLESSPARVPLSADSKLFSQAVELGRHLLWLHTLATRYTSADRPLHRVTRREGMEWLKPVTELPATTR